MSTGNMIHVTTASGDDIQGILDAMAPVLEGRLKHHVLMGCLSLAILLMAPEIEGDRLQEGVNLTSQFICSFLDDEAQQLAELPSQLVN